MVKCHHFKRLSSFVLDFLSSPIPYSLSQLLSLFLLFLTLSLSPFLPVCLSVFLSVCFFSFLCLFGVLFTSLFLTFFLVFYVSSVFFFAHFCNCLYFFLLLIMLIVVFVIVITQKIMYQRKKKFEIHVISMVELVPTKAFSSTKLKLKYYIQFRRLSFSHQKPQLKLVFFFVQFSKSPESLCHVTYRFTDEDSEEEFPESVLKCCRRDAEDEEEQIGDRERQDQHVRR